MASFLWIHVQWYLPQLFSTGGGFWGPIWGNSGNFGPIRGPRARYWSQFGVGFFPFFSPKWPEYSKIMCSATNHNYTILVGPIGVNLEAILGMIWPLSLAQNNFNDPKLFTGAQAINILNSGGRLGAFQVHFGLKKGVKSSPKWLQYLTLRPPNGPKFARIGPKTVPRGPHQYFIVMVSTTIHYFGIFFGHFGMKKGKKSTTNWLQYLALRPLMGPNLPELPQIGPQRPPPIL